MNTRPDNHALTATTEITEYGVCCVPGELVSLWTTKLLTVAVRRTGPGEDSWEVVHPPSTFHSVELGERDRVLREDGVWVQRPYSSALRTAQIEAGRLLHPFDDAMELARTAAANLVLDGRTVAEIIEAARQAEREEGE